MRFFFTSVLCVSEGPRAGRAARQALGALLLGALLLGAVAAGPALADELTWNGIDLGALGIHKGLGLPLLTGFYSASTNLPIVPPGLPANTYAQRVRTVYDFADTLADEDGDDVDALKNVNTTAIQFRETYAWPWQPADPRFRILSELFVPLATVHADVGHPIGVGAGGGGLGDIILEPVELLVSTTGANIATTQIFGAAVIAPTGAYEKDHVFNLGQNIWEFIPAWEYWVELKSLAGLQVHGLLTYTHATKNKDFVLGGSSTENRLLTGKDESEYEFGDMIDTNIDLNIPLPGIRPYGGPIRVGFLAAYERQLDEDKFNGHTVQNSEQESVAIGPLLYWSPGPFNIYFRGAFDVHTQNNLAHNSMSAEITYFFPGGKWPQATPEQTLPRNHNGD